MSDIATDTIGLYRKVINAGLEISVRQAFEAFMKDPCAATQNDLSLVALAYSDVTTLSDTQIKRLFHHVPVGQWAKEIHGFGVRAA